MTCYSDIRILVNYLHTFTWPPTKTYHRHLFSFPFLWGPGFLLLSNVSPKIFADSHQLPGSFTKLLGFQGGYSNGWCVSDIPMTQDPILLCGGLQKTTAFKKGFGPFELSSFGAVRKPFWRSERELQIYICTGCFTGIFIVLPCASHFFLLVGDKEAFECWWGPWVQTLVTVGVHKVCMRQPHCCKSCMGSQGPSYRPDKLGDLARGSIECPCLLIDRSSQEFIHRWVMIWVDEMDYF